VLQLKEFLCSKLRSRNFLSASSFTQLVNRTLIIIVEVAKRNREKGRKGMQHTSKREMSGEAALRFPHGQGSGGHPRVTQRIGMFNVNQKYTLPLKIIIGGVVAVAAFKVAFVETEVKSHNRNFSRRERKGLDYLTNEKDPQLARKWTASPLFKGPFNKMEGRKSVLGMVPSDKALEHGQTDFSTKGELASRNSIGGKPQ